MTKTLFPKGTVVWHTQKKKFYVTDAAVKQGQLAYIKPLRSLGYGDEVVAVTTGIIQKAACEVFSIGQLVRSHHTFVGVVIGFEEDTNRVVCRSKHPVAEANETRNRWAYKINELVAAEVKDQEFTSSEQLFDTSWPEKTKGEQHILVTTTGDSYVVYVGPAPQAGLISIIDTQGTNIFTIPHLESELLLKLGVLKLFKV